MPELTIRMNRVVVPTPLTSPLDDPRIVQLSDNTHDRTLGDPDALSELADHDVRIFGDTEEGVGVVGQKVPARSLGHIAPR